MGSPTSEPRELRSGDRVRWKASIGTVDRVSPEGIHFHVTFDETPNPAPRQLINNGMWFYEHELEALDA
jgi:hypothetical protein